jgi:hypothetical protein
MIYLPDSYWLIHPYRASRLLLENWFRGYLASQIFWNPRLRRNLSSRNSNVYGVWVILNSSPGSLNALLTFSGTNGCFNAWNAFRMKFTVRLSLANGNLYCVFLLKTPNRQRSWVWKICLVWGGKMITFTLWSLKVARTSGLVWIKQLPRSKITDLPVSSRFVWSLSMNGIRTLVPYCWKSVAVTYPYCLCSSTMFTLVRNASICSVSMTLSLTCEETTNGPKDPPAAHTEQITGMCLRLRCTTWWIIWSVIETGMITFRGARSSHSEIHTSSRSNTNSAQEPGRCSLRDATIVSKKDRGTPSRGFSWGRRIVSDCSSLCRNKRELTHPGVTAAPKVSPQ